jgi:hypothetical protein
MPTRSKEIPVEQHYLFPTLKKSKVDKKLDAIHPHGLADLRNPPPLNP